jgi:hypothetical protein
LFIVIKAFVRDLSLGNSEQNTPARGHKSASASSTVNRCHKFGKDRRSNADFFGQTTAGDLSIRREVCKYGSPVCDFSNRLMKIRFNISKEIDRLVSEFMAATE